ncbi:unnamed protein product [Choristocarpus tenellus]
MAAIAIDASLSGRHVAISTSTSSGKSAVYNVAVLEKILGPDRPGAVALYLFPTKALAQDQLRSLKALVQASPVLQAQVHPMTLDGDTPFRERGFAMEKANVILTNPDMLHASVLPGHKRYRRVLGNLAYVVVDEAHVYRGAFGSHVSMVLRRLLRLWALYAGSGPPPQFISCSATMLDSPGHFASLVPLEACLGGKESLLSVEKDTAPCGSKTFVLWNPPVVEEPLHHLSPSTRAAKSPIAATGSETTGSATSVAPVIVVDGGNEDVKGESQKQGAQRSEQVSAVGMVAASEIATGRGRKGRRGKGRKELVGRVPRLSMGEGKKMKGGKSVDLLPPPVSADSALTKEEPGAEVRAKMRNAGEGAVPKFGVKTGVAVKGCYGDGDRGAGARTRTGLRAELLSPTHKRRQICPTDNYYDLEYKRLMCLDVPGTRGVRAGEERAQHAVTGERQHQAGGSEEVKFVKGYGAEGGTEDVEGVAEGSLKAVLKGCGAMGVEEGNRDELLSGEVLELSKDVPCWEEKRRSPIVETAQVLAAVVKQRVRTIAFCRTRKLTELALRYCLQDLDTSAPHLTSLVRGYRGGYTKGDRREIEGKLFANQLLGVTATCALELGVDIGELDVTLHLGFPAGSISSLRQQAGRAGRGGTDSLAIMVLFQDPVSQYFLHNPRELLHKEPEAAVLDAKNDLILQSHLLCAAAECPLGVPHLGGVCDEGLFGGRKKMDEVIDLMMGGDFPRLVKASDGVAGWSANAALDPPPCRRVGLRMIDPVTFSVVDDLREEQTIDHVEYSRAFFSLFEGAIYLHQARQYMVTKLDLKAVVAHVRPVKVDYFTASRNNVDVNVTKVLETSDDNHAHTGAVDVVATVHGYVKIRANTGRTFERGTCSLPSLCYGTRAFWLDIGVGLRETVMLEGHDFKGGVHALAHALLAVIPLFLMCDPEDVDCEHYREFQHRPRPSRVMIFDKRPGGTGVSDSIFSRHRVHSLQTQFEDYVLSALFHRLNMACPAIAASLASSIVVSRMCILCVCAVNRDVMSKALQLLEGCCCPDGCLNCIHDHGCTGYNSLLDKKAALILLRGMIHLMGTKGVGTTTTRGGDDTETSSSGKQVNGTEWSGSTQRRGCSGESFGCDFLLRGEDEGVVSCPASPQGGQKCTSEEEVTRRRAARDVGANDDKQACEGRRETTVPDPTLLSPWKKQRLRNLRLAKGMERARQKDIEVQGCWIPSVP